MNRIRTSFAAAIVCTVLSVILSSAPAPAQTNSWTNLLDGKWEVAGNWSLGVVPNMGQQVFITNALSKVVVIDEQTAAVLTNNLAVDTVTIDGEGNSLLIADVGSVTEVLVASGIVVGAGSELAITNASLQVGAGSEFIVDGLLRISDGAIGPTNWATLAFIEVGDDSSVTGVVQVSGTVLLPRVYVGVGGAGQLVVSNGESSCSFLNVGPTSRGQVIIAGGRLTNHGTMCFGITGQGAGQLFVNGGEFNTPGVVFPGGSALGTGTGEIAISNGLVRMGSVDIVNGGSVSVVGGEFDVNDHLRMRECGVDVLITGTGVLAVTNSSHDAFIEVDGGTLTLDGGMLIADRLIMTNACAKFIQNGGTLIVNGVIGCSNTLSPTAAAVLATGETGSFTVSAPDSCGWIATTVEEWIHVTGSGVGTGTVSYSVDSNASNCAPRSGIIDVYGSPFTIDQAAGIGIFYLLPTDRFQNAGPGTGAISVVASSSNCAWNASSGADWATITSTNAGTGSGTVEYSIAANTNALSRVATITIAGEVFTVTQSGADALDVNYLRARLNFKEPNADRCTLKAIPHSDNCKNLAGIVVSLDVGGAQVAFTLDAKGRGLNTNGSCRLSYNARAGSCTFKVNLGHGSWQTPWAGQGLINATIAKPGIAVTLPVTLVVGDESFIADKPLRYTARAGKSGIAK